MEGLDRTIIEGGDGFGGASMLAGGAGLQSALCQGFSGVNTAVTTQGYESREATNALANQVAQCCCQITRAVEEQGCQNRQLQRQIQAENVASQLCDAKAKIASLEAQQALSLSQQAQTAYLISQLKPTTAAAGA